jgi:biopolymer transport protein ExbD
VKVNKQAPSQRPQASEPAIIDLVPSELPENNNGFAMKLGSRTFTRFSELVDVLRQLDNKHDGAFVRVPPEAPYELAASAIQACKTAGFTQVSYVPKGN